MEYINKFININDYNDTNKRIQASYQHIYSELIREQRILFNGDKCDIASFIMLNYLIEGILFINDFEMMHRIFHDERLHHIYVDELITAIGVNESFLLDDIPRLIECGDFEGIEELEKLTGDDSFDYYDMYDNYLDGDNVLKDPSTSFKVYLILIRNYHF